MTARISAARALEFAREALSKRGPWCGYCGEAFSTREPALAAWVAAVAPAIERLRNTANDPAEQIDAIDRLLEAAEGEA